MNKAKQKKNSQKRKGAKTKYVVKTSNLDQKKLNRVSRRFGITPIAVRELQLGQVEELPVKVADALINAELVEETTEKPRTWQEKVNDLPRQPYDRKEEEDEEKLEDESDMVTNEEKPEEMATIEDNSYNTIEEDDEETLDDDETERL